VGVGVVVAQLRAERAEQGEYLQRCSKRMNS